MEPWIKIERKTRGKPEVRAIAKALGISKVHALGCCAAFWCYADAEMRDGFIRGIGRDDVDEEVELEGFAAAMEAVGWIRFADGGTYVSNPNVHLSSPAKSRSQATKRQDAKRERDRAEAGHGGPSQGETASATPRHAGALHPVTQGRDHKRREEKIEDKRNTPLAPKGADEAVPASDETFFPEFGDGDASGGAPSDPKYAPWNRGFEEWFAVYPRNTEDRFEAEKAYSATIQRLSKGRDQFVAIDELLSKTKLFASSLAAREVGLIPIASKWLWQRKFEADPKAWNENYGGPKSGRDTRNRTSPSRQYDPGHAVDPAAWGARK